MKLLQDPELPDNAFLFTVNATAMFTNIDADVTLNIIPKYIIANEEKIRHDTEVTIAALHIVFCNTLFKLWDKYSRNSGIAMGKQPVLPWSKLTFGMKENGPCVNDEFLKQFEDYLLFYKHHLHYILAIWLVYYNQATNQNCSRNSKNKSLISMGWGGFLPSPQKQMVKAISHF